MTAKRTLLALTLTILILEVFFVFFNWSTDPQCFYRCSEIDPARRTLNTYYRAAQKAVFHQDAELVLVGSSRGETTPPFLIEEIYGLKTLNLSVAGADFQTKRGLLRLAQQKRPLKKIIWLADYFEMLPGRTDGKMLQAQALSQWTDFPKSANWGLRKLQSLVDHNTFEASLHFRSQKDDTHLDYGSGSGVDKASCQESDLQPPVDDEVLQKEVALIYQNYASSVLRGEHSADEMQKLKDYIEESTARGTQWIFWIAPYHPDFRRRLQIEYPEIWRAHLDWIQRLQDLKKQNGQVEVLDFLSSETAFAADSRFWNDGVHFNCRAVKKMLSVVPLKGNL